MDDDFEALIAIGKGDESALMVLMARHREPIFRLAYRYVGNATDAQSLTEETFTKVFFNAHKFKPHGSAKSWVFAIAANVCRDFLRREKRSRSAISLSPSTEGERSANLEEVLSDHSPNAAERLLKNEQLNELQHAIQSLPEKLRFPLIFCVLEGHSQEEAATILKTSRKTVESRIYRARRELQTVLSA